jgi:DNA-binding response OmpR family regulator
MLVVEDDRATRQALAKIFELQGWEVAQAATIEAGLAELDPAPDCLILDLMLPDGDGLTILEEVRTRGLSTRVAVCTGSSDPRRLREVGAWRPDLILFKPIQLASVTALCLPGTIR